MHEPRRGARKAQSTQVHAAGTAVLIIRASALGATGSFGLNRPLDFLKCLYTGRWSFVAIVVHMVTAVPTVPSICSA